MKLNLLLVRKLNKYMFNHIFYRCVSNSSHHRLKANEEPFEKERALVATLIIYCQKLDPNLSDGGSDENSSSKNSSIEMNDDSRPPAAPIPENGMFVYRKNDEDDVLFAGVKKNITSNKKSAKPKKQKVSNLYFL